MNNRAKCSRVCAAPPSFVPRIREYFISREKGFISFVSFLISAIDFMYYLLKLNFYSGATLWSGCNGPGVQAIYIICVSRH